VAVAAVESGYSCCGVCTANLPRKKKMKVEEEEDDDDADDDNDFVGSTCWMNAHLPFEKQCGRGMAKSPMRGREAASVARGARGRAARQSRVEETRRVR
jgi:hypothetical protein